MVMAVWMYVVLFRRIHRRKHTRDFCKQTCWFNFLIQINNGVLAVSEHAPFLLCWYCIQAMFTSVVLYLVYRYWDRPDPSKKLTTDLLSEEGLMSINYVAIAKEFATWYALAAAVLGGVIHKVWSALVGAEKKAKAEVEKLIAEAEAAAKKL